MILLSRIAEFGHATSPMLVSFALQGALLMLATGLTVLALRRAPAALRHLVWALALVGLLLLPVLSALVPSWEVPVLCGAVWVPHEVPLAPPAAVEAGPPIADRLPRAGERDMPATRHTLVAGVPFHPPDSAPAASASGGTDWLAWLSVLWFAGVLLCLLPLLAGMLAVSRLARRAQPAAGGLVAELIAHLKTDGPAAPYVRVRMSPTVRIPMTWGVFRPVVLLPSEACTWPRGKLLGVLRHELAHVRRCDVLMHGLARLSVSFHWFNPLAWIALRRLRSESERACDDIVVTAGSHPAQYANYLLEIARSARGASRSLAAAVPMARPSQLEGRLLALLDTNRNRRGVGPGGRTFALGAALCAALPLAMLQVSGTDYTVALDGTAAYTSIQKAVDAAAEGGVVRIAPGLYEERITITKPVILEGAGWDKTLITSEDETARLYTGALRAEIEKRMGSASSDQERAAIIAEYKAKFGPKPTIGIHKAKGVVLRNLKVSLRGTHREGTVGHGAIIELIGSKAHLEKCVAAGSPAHGIVVSDGANVEIRTCLVAGVWGTGISIRGKETPAYARIEDSDVRNCHHRGIVVARGNNAAVQGCRISGSAWHGIRYDSASPAITGNAIFRNARCGIYASGRTQATVTGNLFYANEMTGIGCWFTSRDTIERNTFTGNVRSGLEVLGAAHPAIRKNIFHGNPQAIYRGDIGSDSPHAVSDGTLTAETNIFWQNEVTALWRRAKTAEREASEEKIVLSNSNVIVDPRFTDSAKEDFSLAADSPAQAAGIGAPDHPSLTSPWPIQPEEGAVIAQRTSRKRQTSRDMARFAHTMAKPWIDGAMSIRDHEARAEAVAQIRAALASGDPTVAYAGLIAFLRTTEVNYDKAPFRDLILPLARTAEGDMQVKAFYALFHANRQPEDLDLVLAAARNPSPEMHESASHLLKMYNDNQLTGEVGDVVLDLLQAENRGTLREVMRGIWGAHVSPGVESRLMELAETDLRHDAIYFGLSTLQEKSRRVVETLMKAAEDADPNNSGRAIWGLGHGVAEENHPLVADFALDLFEARSSPRARGDCMFMLEQYAGPSHIEPLEKLAANELVGDDLRERARKLAERLRQRAEE